MRWLETWSCEYSDWWRARRVRVRRSEPQFQLCLYLPQWLLAFKLFDQEIPHLWEGANNTTQFYTDFFENQVRRCLWMKPFWKYKELCKWKVIIIIITQLFSPARHQSSNPSFFRNLNILVTWKRSGRFVSKCMVRYHLLWKWFPMMWWENVYHF